jgi:predicted unusual protein kinase regulating ubiquinone biosynthesis (AarF/ABC1/UbiB family)
LPTLAQLTLSCRHGVRLESNFTKIVLTIMIVEAMGRSLDPRQDILVAAAPYLVRRKITEETRGFAEKVDKFTEKISKWFGARNSE